MIKRAFFSMTKPQLEYRHFVDTGIGIESLPDPARVILLHPGAFERTDTSALKVGDAVQAGEKLVLYLDRDDYIISTVTGTISDISPLTGDYGKKYAAITIDCGAEELIKEDFSAWTEVPSLQTARNFLDCLPGTPEFKRLDSPDPSIEQVIVSGVDTDLLVQTRQHVARYEADAIEKGIHILKTITGIDSVCLALPGDLIQGYGEIGVPLRPVAPQYPSGHPSLLVPQITGRIIPAGKSPEDLGVAILSVESVARLGEAFSTGRIPTRKILTLIEKDSRKRLVSARIGTPIGQLFQAYGIHVKDGDRIILGGPMNGTSIYSENQPVTAETDAIMVQDHSQIAPVSDYPCVNCGDCVRACPANIQVNMLVRFLEAGQYDTAADEYDLHSCIDCGLCAFVCVSRIPVFQYIKLAKYELSRMQAAEEEHG